MLRDLTSNVVGQLVVIPGIITAASKTEIKATNVTMRCSNCGHEKSVALKHGFGGAALPRQCDMAKATSMDKSQCPLDPYRIVPDKCEYLDRQTLKLQEAPELVPTGDMPRTFLMTVDRELTDKVTPGNRVKVVGILAIVDKGGSSTVGANRGVKETVKVSYLRVLGLQSVSN